MKKKYLLLAMVMMTTLCVAQDEVKPYMTVDQLPNLIKCLPAPPAFDSPEFSNDLMSYAWGKKQRQNEERAAMVKRDAVWSYEALFAEFNVPFGLEISEQGTPEIWKLLITSLTTTDAMRVAPKAYYHRLRPFELLGDSLLTDGEAQYLRGEGSYPSGHTIRGWSAALILSEINPDAAEALYERGWDYGESRVISGAHWQSDVDMSRAAASIGYSFIQTSPAFRLQMEKAKAEFRRVTRKNR